MAEYIDREGLKEHKVYSTERHEYVVPVAKIDWQPTADVVEVVRCKECGHFMEYSEGYKQAVDGADGDCYIRLFNSENRRFAACKYDDYCSYGERKEQEP